jgi:hypothetical protein
MNSTMKLIILLFFSLGFGSNLFGTTPCTALTKCRQFFDHIQIFVEINNRKTSKFIPFDIQIDELTKLNINASNFLKKFTYRFHIWIFG